VGSERVSKADIRDKRRAGKNLKCLSAPQINTDLKSPAAPSPALRHRLPVFYLCASVAGSKHLASSIQGLGSRIKHHLLFWRERGDDLLEARIAAKRIPEGVQF
jgi:hypothetical protein